MLISSIGSFPIILPTGKKAGQLVVVSHLGHPGADRSQLRGTHRCRRAPINLAGTLVSPNAEVLSAKTPIFSRTSRVAR